MNIWCISYEYIACTNGYGQIVTALLATGKTDINYNHNGDGEPAIIAAVKKQQKHCVELLLNHRLHGQVCDINVRLKTNSQSPIFIACDKGDVEIGMLECIMTWNG